LRKPTPKPFHTALPVAFFPGQKYSETEFEAYLWPEGGWENILHAFFQNVTTTTLDATNNVYQHVFRPAALNTTPTYTTRLRLALTRASKPSALRTAWSTALSSASAPKTRLRPLLPRLVGRPPRFRGLHRPTPRSGPSRTLTHRCLIGGSAAELQELTIELNNNLERRHDLAAALRAIELQNLEVSGSFSVRFRDATHLNRFLNASETSLKVTLTGPVAGGSHNYRLEVELARIVYDAWKAEISEAELLVQDVDFQALKPSTDDVVKVTLVNKVSSI
jgi:hypothetical protein